MKPPLSWYLKLYIKLYKNSTRGENYVDQYPSWKYKYTQQNITDQIQQFIRRSLCHNQMGFISEMQDFQYLKINQHESSY